MRKQHADAIRKAAKGWQPAPNDDAEMRALYRKDRAALRRVATLLETGKVARARRAAENLDTIIRELIPDGPWDFLHSDAVVAELVAEDPAWGRS